MKSKTYQSNSAEVSLKNTPNFQNPTDLRHIDFFSEFFSGFRQDFHFLQFQRFLIFSINPSRPNPGRREKNKLHFYFQTSLWCLKRFSEGLNGLYKPF